MKKIVTILFLLASLTIILDSFSVWHMLLEFMFAGIIPGTNISLNPSLMLMLIAVTTGLLIGWIFIVPSIRKYYFVKVKKVSLKSRQLTQA